MGPLCLNISMLPQAQIMESDKVCNHNYADDSQIYIGTSPGDHSLINEQINNWMSLNFLQLNTDKTEVIIFGAKQ